MVFFGIDPGSRITGYGVIRAEGNRARWVDSGVIRTPSDAALAEKLLLIYERLLELMACHRPDWVCVEEAFYAKNVHTTLVLGQARGVALLAGAKTGARIEEYSARTVKQAVVGKGSATKEQVAYMVKMLLAPPCKHVQTDAFDALAVALCAFGKIGARRAMGIR
jgi:crossover junction endodeoxyribonuclease RuvC